jgi:hypothetical protein
MKKSILIILMVISTYFSVKGNLLFFQCEVNSQAFNSTALGDEEQPYDLKFFEKNITGNSGFGHSIANAGDVNGDGYEDIIVGAYNYLCTMRRVYIYYGGPEIDTIPDVIINSLQQESRFGHSVSSAGDINKDGFADVIVGDYNHNNQTGCAYIYFGGTQMDTITDVHLQGEYDGDCFGYCVSIAGDVNNDGDSDIIVGARNYSNGTGKGYIYYGGTLWDTIADIVLQGEEECSYFGTCVASAGDVNNDGIDDILVGASGYFNGVGRAYVYFGGSVADSIFDVVFEGEEPNDYLGICVSSAGDINNDGIDDIAVGASGRGTAYVYLGGTDMESVATYTLYGDITPSAYNQSSSFGRSIISSGDVNNDGIDDLVVAGRDSYYFNHSPNQYVNRSYIFYGGNNFSNYDLILYSGYSISTRGDFNGDNLNDIVIGDYMYNSYSGIHAKHTNVNMGRVYLYHGSDSIDNKPDFIIDGEGTDNKYGYCISSAGDVNNDGYNDMIIGAYGYKERTGRAYIYLGGNTTDTIPDIVLEGERIHDQFGICVSSAGDVNNDGYDDIIIGADNYGWYMDYVWTDGFENYGKGAAYLYYGGENMDSIADAVFEGDIYAEKFGQYLTGIGDVNNDGFNDIFIGAEWINKGYIYYGGDSIDSEFDQTFPGGKTGAFLGDINNDGVDDFSIGSAIYFGNETTVDFDPDLTLPVSLIKAAYDLNNDGVNDIIGLINDTAYVFWGGSTIDTIPDLNLGHATSISSIADINQDGFSDIVVGQKDFASSMGKALVFCGGEQMDSIADIVIIGEKTEDYFGYSTAGAGDVNNDGYGDIIIGAYQNDFNGAVYLYQGKDMVLFNKHPESLTLCEGDIASFSVVANQGAYFQWEKSVDSGKVYHAINDNEMYSGTSTANLRVVLKKTLNNSLYRCQVSKEDLKKYSQPAKLTINSLPISKLFGGDTICAGDSSLLRIELKGNGPWDIELSNGEESVGMHCIDSLLTIYTDSSGIYKLVKLNDINCPGINLGNEIPVVVNELPTATLIGGDTICEGDTAFLNVSLTGVAPWTYWLTDGDASTIIVINNKNESLIIKKEGSYKIIALKDANCEGLDITGEADVVVNPLPAGIFCGEDSFCAGDTNKVCTYFTGTPPWKFILTDTKDSTELSSNESPYYFNIDSVGIYTINSITDANCLSKNTCGEITVRQCTGIEESLSDKIEIFPNPTKGKVSVKGIPHGTNIEIVALSGEVVYKSIASAEVLELDLSKQPKGIYLLRAISEEKISVSKIIFN